MHLISKVLSQFILNVILSASLGAKLDLNYKLHFITSLNSRNYHNNTLIKSSMSSRDHAIMLFCKLSVCAAYERFARWSRAVRLQSFAFVQIFAFERHIIATNAGLFLLSVRACVAFALRALNPRANRKSDSWVSFSHYSRILTLDCFVTLLHKFWNYTSQWNKLTRS